MNFLLWHFEFFIFILDFYCLIFHRQRWERKQERREEGKEREETNAQERKRTRGRT